MQIGERILKEIDSIEKQHDIEVIYAIESGSRAWGFASNDSDYDVRFIYKHTKDFYLRIDSPRDVIEHMLDETLDINGWDIKKTLKLLHNSNPTLFEWLNSPIVYKKTQDITPLCDMANNYFCAKSGLYHYLNMAEGNYREYLKTDNVRLKKYFYVVRPILACKHILSCKTPPPMLFNQLTEMYLHGDIKTEIDKLLEIKINQPESKLIPKVQIINDYIEENFATLKQQIAMLEGQEQRSIDDLNNVFLQIIDK